MIEGFNAVIAPLNKKLANLLYINDYDVIPVKVTFSSGTTQVIEDGMVAECDHKGAELDCYPLDTLYYNPTDGSVETLDDHHVGLVCDKCLAWQDVEGEWHE